MPTTPPGTRRGRRGPRRRRPSATDTELSRSTAARCLPPSIRQASLDLGLLALLLEPIVRLRLSHQGMLQPCPKPGSPCHRPRGFSALAGPAVQGGDRRRLLPTLNGHEFVVPLEVGASFAPPSDTAELTFANREMSASRRHAASVTQPEICLWEAAAEHRTNQESLQ